MSRGALDVDAFIKRWSNLEGGAERANYALFLCELCDVTRSKTLAALWTAYHQSPEFDRLKPRTKTDYGRVRDWLGGGAHAAVLSSLTAEDVLKLRDKAF